MAATPSIALFYAAHINLTQREQLELTRYSVYCNNSCCKYSEDEIICFGEYNYTDRNTLTIVANWELAVRWSFTALVMLVAVLGNLTIITILAKNRLLLRTSVNHFILNLSVADLITALAGPVPFTLRDTQTFWPLGETWCYLEGYIQMLVMLVSVTSLATISCDRMIGVVLPFHQHLKKWQSITIIIIIWLSSAMLAIPWGIYRVYTVHLWQDMTQTICGESDNIYIWWIVAVIGLTWLPLIIMVISYATILIYFKHKSFRSSVRNEHPVMTHLKKRVVKMMFVVLVIFIVCWLPFQILMISDKAFLDDYGQFKDEATKTRYEDLLTVSQYMIYANPAVNPVIYGLMHQTFRRAFRVTFPCIFKRKSSLVLRKGQGLTRYMWSVKSATSRNTDSHRVPSNTVQQASSLSEVSPAHGNSSKTSTKKAVNFKTLSQDSTKNMLKRKSSPLITPCPCMAKRKKVRTNRAPGKYNDHPRGTFENGLCKCGAKRCQCHTVSTVCECRGVGKTGVVTVTVSEVSPATYTNEGFVTDLPPRSFSIISTGALGSLITQVIVEENSSDVERERIL